MCFWLSMLFYIYIYSIYIYIITPPRTHLEWQYTVREAEVCSIEFAEEFMGQMYPNRCPLSESLASFPGVHGWYVPSWGWEPTRAKPAAPKAGKNLTHVHVSHISLCVCVGSCVLEWLRMDVPIWVLATNLPLLNVARQSCRSLDLRFPGASWAWWKRRCTAPPGHAFTQLRILLDSLAVCVHIMCMYINIT